WTTTSSPTVQSATFGPTALITPAPSKPTRRGSVNGGDGRMPRRSFQSIGFTPAARISTTTSPSPGSGSGPSVTVRTSGPPVCEYVTKRAMPPSWRSRDVAARPGAAGADLGGWLDERGGSVSRPDAEPEESIEELTELGEHSLLLHAVMSVRREAGRRREDPGDRGAGAGDGAVPERLPDELSCLVGLESFLGDDRVELRGSLGLDVLGPLLVDLSRGGGAVDEVDDEVLLVAPARAGVD